jgi:hypothetical protein
MTAGRRARLINWNGPTVQITIFVAAGLVAGLHAWSFFRPLEFWYDRQCMPWLTLYQGAAHVEVNHPNAIVGPVYFQTILPLWPLTSLLCIGAAALWWHDFKVQRRPDPGHCPRCGYDLSGLASATSCPECGARRAPAP